MRHFFLATARSALVVLLATLSGITNAQAQTDTAFPDRPVTIITPFSAGSGPDAVLRMVAESLTKQWGQTVIIDNRPGGAGFIAIEQARRAKPDGYTLLQLDSEQISALPYLYPSRKISPLEIFEPVAALFRTPFFIAVPSNSPWKNMGDLIKAAQTNPDSVSYGSWGVGSPGHLGALQLEKMSHTKMLHIPYKETAQLYVNLGGNEIQWAFASVGSSESLYRKGSLKYLAIAAKSRHPGMPDVPTVAEAGGPQQLTVDSFAVLLAPKGTNTKIIEKIHADVWKAVQTEKVKNNYAAFAFEHLDWSPQEITRISKLKGETYEKLVREGNIRLD
ncbi:tripartite tricarboxylate transporter substrate binding protein [Advenella alkanexedens]|jgi:tripartite-type tricarboxylate transporter receptor subunit TctC|uniref:Tripartite tricarboxylate transporter substrate binding protein n=1 Tax=Advenella alkanexedens TaxID=1481665 RepID=A0ABS6NNB1_9BURK|nr:tripartite tricarboxylate transporter substrate binding protein [Advenella alkanexedens]MBV4397116.1 tripartite tricarboxylate transporter substrate binding protein [Advenella alkanexedens]NLN68258.1 tripartite tricarboxylate transporter substrate binding protein [Alcaligenaceae bacterium]